jgi:hypothetical protein
LLLEVDRVELENVEKALDELFARWHLAVHPEGYQFDNEKDRVRFSVSLRIKTGKKRATFVSEAAALHGVYSVSLQ